jgi:hypothetical protein
MSNGRDTQRSKLYDSEHQVFRYDRDFTTVRQAQKWSNSITGSRWWKGLGGPSFVLIKQTRSDANTSTALGRRNEIKLAPGMMSKWVLLHELAHIAMFHIARNRPSHGPEYALVYRRLIEEFLGDEWRQHLGVAFERNGVKSSTSDQRVINALAQASGETL